MSTIPSTGQVSFGDLNEAMGLSRTSQRNSNDATLRKFHDTSSSTTMKLSDFRNRSYFTVTQTGSQSAFNLKSHITFNVNGGVWPTGPVIANYIINSGVTLSGSGALPGFSTGQNVFGTNWPAFSKVYMTNNGTIQGSTGAPGAAGASGIGGTGGTGGVNDAAAGGGGATGGAGSAGGIAAEFTVTSIVTNNGSIIGGTGGSGGAGGAGGGGGGGGGIGDY